MEMLMNSVGSASSATTSSIASLSGLSTSALSASAGVGSSLTSVLAASAAFSSASSSSVSSLTSSSINKSTISNAISSTTTPQQNSAQQQQSNTNGNDGNTSANGEDLVTLEAEISELQRENARVESQMLRLKSDINAMESQLSNGDREITIIPGQRSGDNLNNYYESLRNNVITLLEHVRIPSNTSAGTYPPNTNSLVTTSMSSIPSVVSSTSLPLPVSTNSTNLSTGGQTISHHHLSHPLQPTSIYSHSHYPPNLMQHHHGTLPPPPPPNAGTASHILSSAIGAPSMMDTQMVASSSSISDKIGHHEHFDSYISKLQSLCAPPESYGLITESESRPIYETVKSQLSDYTVLPTPI